MDDVAIGDLLATLGLVGENAVLGRAALERSGLTNARKTRISMAKVGTAGAAIDAELARLCRRCAAQAGGEARRVVIVDDTSCSRCSGSANARALDELVAAATAAGATRLVVVG
ncbi:MAG: hypothetical protein FJW96_02675, partial [Actinobacteria bacterium]|nr:hypothetical protein [Actinomycetota bacterium]